MKLYNPMKDTQYIEVPSSKEDNEKLILMKYKEKAKEIKEELETPGSDN